MRALVRLVGALALGLAVAGCGSGLSDQAAIELQQRVDAVRAAAPDSESMAVAVNELRATVTALLDSGEIDADKASEILAAADSVQNALVLLPTTTLEDDHGKGKGKGKGGKGED